MTEIETIIWIASGIGWSFLGIIDAIFNKKKTSKEAAIPEILLGATVFYMLLSK